MELAVRRVFGQGIRWIRSPLVGNTPVILIMSSLKHPACVNRPNDLWQGIRKSSAI